MLTPNYYYAALQLTKLLKYDEAMNYIERAMQTLDKNSAEPSYPANLTKFRFQKSKILKMQNKNIEAYRIIQEAIEFAKDKPALKVESH